MAEIRILLATPDPTLAAEAAALIDESAEMRLVGTARDSGEVGAALERVDADAVLIHEDLGPVPVLDLARQLSAANPQVGLILAVREDTRGKLRAAMRSGIRDVLPTPLTLEALQSAVASTAEAVRAVRSRIEGDRSAGPTGRTGARTIAVAGGKGGVGTTTIALHLALAGIRGAADGQRLDGDRICLAELDLQAGDLRTYLDVPHRRSIADLAGIAGEIGPQSLVEVLYVHESGLRVLFAPEQGEDAEELGDAATRRILSAMRFQHSLVVLDLGATVTEAGAAAVELADRVVVVATPDVPALRGANRLLRLWRRLDVDLRHAVIVLNRVSRGAEVQPELARRVALAPIARTVIPAGFRDLEAAANSGLPERLAQGPVRRGLDSLAAELAGESPPEAPADDGSRPVPDAESRLASERGQASVETVGLVGIVALVALALWQIVLVGYTFALAGHSAREGARALAVGESGESAARSDIPGAWRDGMDYEERSDDPVEQPYAKVTLAVPVVLPGLDSPIEVSSTEHTVVEGAPLPEDAAARSSPATTPDSFEGRNL
jgi:pilus assembly protein CpaE